MLCVSHLRRFLKDRRGNIAMMFGFMLVPIMSLAGAGLDYARFINRTTQLQAAVDAAALEGAKTTSVSTFSSGQSAATKMFNADISTDSYTTVSALNITQSGNNIVVTATGTIKTTITALLGISTVPFTVTAQANYVQPWLEIMMVLDITGSMNSSGKLSAMKTAASTMVTTLFSDSQISPRLAMGIVPFNTEVNIGTSYAGSWWLKTDTSDLNSPYALSGYQWVWTYYGWQYQSYTNAWAGCLVDRDTAYDQNNTQPVNGTTATYYREAACEYTTPLTIPLTTTSSTLTTAINGLTANGNTNIPIGLQTAFAILTPGVPFNSSSSDTTRTIKRIIVLLTDGENTNGRYGSVSSPSQDTRTSNLCTAIKNYGITLYTVDIIDGDVSLLKSCATSADLFFQVTSSSGIGPALATITANIQSLRLTQ